MDDKLRVFCTVAELKSFSKASEVIHLTQPAVSSQIQVLEEFYNTKLFERTTSSVILTPSGEILYDFAKRILSLYTDAEKTICKLTGLVKGSIKIGATSLIGHYMLTVMLADFRKISPKLKISLRLGNSKRIIEMMNTAAIDIGFVEGEIKAHKITAGKLYTDELLLIVPASHPLAKFEDISIEKALKEPFIVRDDLSSSGKLIEEFFCKCKINMQHLKIFMVSESIEAIKSAVLEGLGVAFLSKLSVKKEILEGKLMALRIKKNRITQDISVVYSNKNNSSYMVEEFLSFARSYKYDEVFAD
ncbi:LysR family transcriptional regulator [Candidatus Magnetominusculus xianensis]|uniref:LysR family transcriptional regulator n=1 Tax=Candidatus Magnetominusculus xianensis TaxID=1748249 RepID=A0ABR5SCC2_9BACT|nr:LysR family transcriptional regulator [Candidatus Magnetominusculus xianensis]KWT79572.1 LysR family transcriptional regulator [Candidatus Magnetominusculus xianensis]MBF0405626.1 LysR family transcriptional regulator [Nitrospirota bacterium]